MKNNKANTKNDKTKELIEKLENGIQNLYSSENYINYLKTISKFHNYSINNSLLIALQNPYAKCVAGFNSWKTNFKRTVNKGEKGIKILAPAPYKIKLEKQKIDPESKKPLTDKNGNPITEMVEMTKPCFRVVHVFDVLQTSGEPLPTIANELKADVENFDNFYNILKKVSPFPVNEKDITTGANGYCDPANKEIAIRTGMSESQSIKTCIHEIAHSILHVNHEKMDKDKNTKEVEAESIAFVVSNHFGIETSDYSFGYIAGWSTDKELKELKSSLDTIQKTANKLITKIESAYKELQVSKQNIKDSIIHDNEIDLDREKIKSSDHYYGKIDFLGSNGNVGETIYYKDRKSFEREEKESTNIGRPIDSIVFNNKKSSIKDKIYDAKKKADSIFIKTKKLEERLGR